MSKKITGTVRGNTIIFDQPLGLSDGRQVTVELRTEKEESNWETAVMRLAGSMAGDEQFDAAMRQIEQDRKIDTRPIE